MANRFGAPPKQKLLPLGPYPAIGLAEARQAAQDAKAIVAKGIDPGHRRKADKLGKANSAANTFSAIADALVAKKVRERKADRTISKIKWLLSLAAPFIGDLPIAEITALQVLAALRSVESTGLLETARRMRAVNGEVFRFAIEDGKATNNPTLNLRASLAAPTITFRRDPGAKGVWGAVACDRRLRRPRRHESLFAASSPVVPPARGTEKRALVGI